MLATVDGRVSGFGRVATRRLWVRLSWLMCVDGEEGECLPCSWRDD